MNGHHGRLQVVGQVREKCLAFIQHRMKLPGALLYLVLQVLGECLVLLQDPAYVPDRENPENGDQDKAAVFRLPSRINRLELVIVQKIGHHGGPHG